MIANWQKLYGKRFVKEYSTTLHKCQCGKEFILLTANGICPACHEDYRYYIKKLGEEYKKYNKRKDDEDKDPEMSCVITDDYIAEQIYLPEREVSLFLVKYGDIDNLEEVDNIKFKGTVIKPCSGEEVIKRAILLPSGTAEYLDDTELDNRILKFIHKWLDVPEHIEKFGLWNIKRSWVYERFYSLNYLRALGDFGTGKSRFLDTFGLLHYKPISTSGATTPAPVFRMIEKWKGTLIMDEADWAKSDAAQDMIKIINCGYEKGKHIMRCDQNDANKIQFFDSFCPKILATRFPFYDKATESRCITHVMTTTVRQDIPVNLNASFFEEVQELRNMLLLWRMRNWRKIQPDVPLGLDLPHIEPSVRQIVNSFVSLFTNDAQKELFKDFIIKHQEEVIEARRDTIEGQIVQAIVDIITETGCADISAEEIVAKAGLTDTRDNPMKPKKISSIMKGMGFGKSIVKRIGDRTKRCINIERHHISGLLEKFGYDKNNLLHCYECYTLCGEPQNSKNGQNQEKTENQGLSSYSVTSVTPKQEKIDEIVMITENDEKNDIPITPLFIDSIKAAIETEAQKIGKKEVNIEDVQSHFDFSIDHILDHLKMKGEAYEPSPGRIALL